MSILSSFKQRYNNTIPLTIERALISFIVNAGVTMAIDSGGVNRSSIREQKEQFEKMLKQWVEKTQFEATLGIDVRIEAVELSDPSLMDMIKHTPDGLDALAGMRVKVVYSTRHSSGTWERHNRSFKIQENDIPILTMSTGGDTEEGEDQ